MLECLCIDFLSIGRCVNLGKINQKIIVLCISLLMLTIGSATAQSQTEQVASDGTTVAMVGSDGGQTTGAKEVASNQTSGNTESAKPKDAWDLAVGSRGDQVIQLQKILAQVGYYPAIVDGVYGGQTELAVKKAQGSLGLAQTGRADRMLVEGVRRMTEMSPSRSGAGFRSNRVLTMEATAYTPYDSGVVGITASGHPMRRGLVAVDPRVIPMGTRMYIEGYGYAIASDTGGAIRGHKIDLAVDTLAEAYQIGRRKVTVHILE
jgi:3D (Asp-Asp-Asp) domain-containing protein